MGAEKAWLRHILAYSTKLYINNRYLEPKFLWFWITRVLISNRKKKKLKPHHNGGTCFKNCAAVDGLKQYEISHVVDISESLILLEQLDSSQKDLQTGVNLEKCHVKTNSLIWFHKDLFI